MLVPAESKQRPLENENENIPEDCLSRINTAEENNFDITLENTKEKHQKLQDQQKKLKDEQQQKQ